MTAIVISAVGGLIALIVAFIGGHVVGGNKKVAELQPQIDAAKQQTQDVVTQSKVADAEVKQAADDKSAQVEAIIKNVNDRVDALPEGEAQKELEQKYGADK